MAILGISVKDNKEQQEFVRLIQEKNKPIIFCEGLAGTGKSFIALATALELREQKKYNHIYYIRDAIQVGHDIGHLPGTADEKMEPYWGPVMDSLEAIIHASENGKHMNINDLAAKIEVVPLAFIRGRSFTNSIVIVDEAESFDLTALKTVLTRVDRWSKVIILGSLNQIDDWRQRKKDKSDFQRVMEVLVNNQDYSSIVGYVHLEKSMRSEWTTLIDDALSSLEDETEHVDQWHTPRSTKERRPSYEEWRYSCPEAIAAAPTTGFTVTADDGCGNEITYQIR